MSTVDVPESKPVEEAAVSEQTTSSDRTERFRSDVASMRLSDSNPGLERGLTILGWVLIAAAIVLTIMAIVVDTGANVAYNTEGPANQRDAIVWAVSGVVFAITGLALVVRYSFAKFLRFWLARLIYEQQAGVDRIISGKK
jgi:hypothetical protein